MLIKTIVGFLTVSATILLHAGGTAWWLHRLRSRSRPPHETLGQWAVLSLLVKTALVLITLHVIEVFIWALTFLLLPGSGLSSLEEAMYFSFATFTTLGYGDVTVDESWRFLTGIEALNGVILIGWSTALSFAVIQRVWKDPREDGERH